MVKKPLAPHVAPMVISVGTVMYFIASRGWTAVSIGMAVFIAIAWPLYFYRILTIPLVRIAGRRATVSTHPFLGATEFELPTSGEWCYNNNYLALPSSDATTCERLVTLTDSQTDQLTEALAALGISRVSVTEFKERERSRNARGS